MEFLCFSSKYGLIMEENDDNDVGDDDDDVLERSLSLVSLFPSFSCEFFSFPSDEIF